MKVRASATKRPWTRAATKRTRRKSPPPSVRDPAIAVASGGDATWRTFGERMFELERGPADDRRRAQRSISGATSASEPAFVLHRSMSDVRLGHLRVENGRDRRRTEGLHEVRTAIIHEVKTRLLSAETPGAVEEA